MKDIKVQDAIAGSWVDRYAPVKTRPYLRLSRLDRPVGAWLLFLPCVFATFLSGAIAGAGWGQIAHVLIVCAIGSWLMRGAGCTWNDIVDRKIDAQVERTLSRPLPSGQVSVKQALIWMVAQMAIAAIGLFTFRGDVILLTLGSLVIVAIYPFAKRFTNWPQLVLGLCFNWGVLVAWSQMTGGLSASAYLFYIAMIFWTLFYDTIYAFQDIEDDALIGVKSSALALGDKATRGLWIMLGGVGILGLLALIIIEGAKIMVFAYTFICFVVWLGRHVKNFDQANPQVCLEQFRANVVDGQLLALLWLLCFITS